MKRTRRSLSDPDLKNVGRSLRRAARDAFELARRTGTPFYVYRAGRIVDLGGRNDRNRRAARTRV